MAHMTDSQGKSLSKEYETDEDDEIESEDSFTERSESEEPEINPATGRSVRRATKKQIKYEESEDEIEDLR